MTGYRAARRALRLGAGQDHDVEVITDFEPDTVIVDPDVQVLQLRRQLAVHRS